jgi:hypothetical protein
MGFMFLDAVVFNQDLSSWVVSSITTALKIFQSCPMFTEIVKYPPFDGVPPDLPTPLNSYYI